MTNMAEQTAPSRDPTAKVSLLDGKRTQLAQERFKERTEPAFKDQIADLVGRPMAPWDIWTQWLEYSTDLAQRTILFWDTRRQRGDNFLAHEQAVTALLRDPADRERFLTLLKGFVEDPRIQVAGATDAQREMPARVRGVLGEGAIEPELGLPEWA